MEHYINLFDENVRKIAINNFKIGFFISSFIEIILLFIAALIRDSFVSKTFLLLSLFFGTIPISVFLVYISNLNQYGQLIKIEDDNIFIYKFNKKLKYKIDLKTVFFSNYRVLIYGGGRLIEYIENECLVLHFQDLEHWRFIDNNVIDYKYCYKDDSVLIIQNKELIDLLMNYYFKNQKS